MIVIVLQDSSKTWYREFIGTALEVREHGNNDKYLVYNDRKAKSYKNRKKILIKSDCEILPL